MVETHMDRNITDYIANGNSSIYYDELSPSYAWTDAYGGSLFEFAHVDFIGAYLGTLRALSNFDISAIESANVKVKAIKVTVTYAPQGANTDTLDVRQLTTLRYTTDSAETVFGEIGSATSVANGITSTTQTSLSATAISQMETFLSDGEYALGYMGDAETGDVENTISANVLYVQYYYPPNEADTWEINESYPIGRSTGLGVGAISSTQAVEVTASGTLTLNGNTALTIPTGNYLSIAYGGSLEVESTASLIVAY